MTALSLLIFISSLSSRITYDRSMRSNDIMDEMLVIISRGQNNGGSNNNGGGNNTDVPDEIDI